MDEYLEQLLGVAPENDFIDYLVERLQRDDYRGMHVSQHNRLTLDYVLIMLKAIGELGGGDGFAVPP